MSTASRGASLPERYSSDSPWLEDDRWIAAKDLASTTPFVRSPRLSQLFLFLAFKTVANESERITEQEIARVVFGRDNSFHSSSDTIVRSHLVRLRQRLEQHATLVDSASQRFRILIPRGQYRVDFEELPVPHLLPAVEASDVRELPAPATRTSIVKRSYVPWVLVLLVSTIVAYPLAMLRGRAVSKAVTTKQMWNSIFFSDHKIIFVAADSSLVILHQYLHHDTSLADYLAGTYRDHARQELGDQSEVLSVANRRYTSMVDVSIMQHLGELAAMHHNVVEARYARELSIEDLKQNNVVLSGSRGANPWLELFEPQMNFVVTNDYEHNRVLVQNRHPALGEPLEYVEGSGKIGDPLFGVLAFLPNLGPSNDVLVLEGTSLAATQAICDLAFDEHALLPLLKKMRRKDGSMPHFELLISSTVVNGNASKFQMLSYRTYD